MEHSRLWISVFTAIVGVAILAVIFSAKSATSGVISAAGNALGTLLAVAVSPITGASPIKANSVAASGAGPSGGGAQAANFAGSGAGGFGPFSFSGGNIGLPNITVPNIGVGGGSGNTINL